LKPYLKVDIVPILLDLVNINTIDTNAVHPLLYFRRQRVVQASISYQHYNYYTYPHGRWEWWRYNKQG